MTRSWHRSLIWRLLDGTGWEQCAVRHLAPSAPDDPATTRYDGVLIAVDDRRPVLIHYTIERDRAGDELTCAVRSEIGTEERREIALRHLADGSWTLQEGADGPARPLPALATASEPDLEFSPLTNTLAIERLALAVGQRAELVTAWVRFPSLTVEPFPQRYTRLSERVYRFDSDGFSAEIEVDERDLVVRYGDLWERIAVGDSA